MSIAPLSENWPVDEAALSAGRQFLHNAASNGRTLIAYHDDADGICAGLLVTETLQRQGAAEVVPTSTGKGESIYALTMRQRIQAFTPESLIVVDMGSRSQPIITGLPSLIIDHHQPEGIPSYATFVSSFGHQPIAPASLLSFILCAPIVDLVDRKWVAVVGTVADLGPNADISFVKEGLRQFGHHNITETIALVNAAKRASSHDVDTAFDIVRQASSPKDIAKGRVPGVKKLRRYRKEVAVEVAKASRTRPVFAGQVALVRFGSKAQVHPLVAIRWARHLPHNIIIAANDNYLPNRVNFAIRTMLDINLIAYLRNLRLGPLEGEYGFGHVKATGGSLSPTDFERLLEAIGFQPSQKLFGNPL